MRLNHKASNFLFRLSIILFVAACSTTKHVSENSFLLDENKIIFENEKEKEVDKGIEKLIIQQPNATAFGIKLPLLIHNISDPNFEEKHQKWVQKKMADLRE